MPRRARLELAGAIHHVTAKAPSGRLLFQDDEDRQRYLQLLAREIVQRGWQLLTFCLLSNHVHLLVRTPEPDLGNGLKRAHEDFARHMNRRRAEHGHLFGAPFYNGIVATERHVAGCLRYIARNPVEAGICRQPREWPWSAHRALAGLSGGPSFLDVAAAYEHLDADPDRARVAYVQLVAKTDEAVLADLVQPGSDSWLVTARDDFAVSVDGLAAFLRASRSHTYARLATARSEARSVPSVQRRTEGSIPSVLD